MYVDHIVFAFGYDVSARVLVVALCYATMIVRGFDACVAVALGIDDVPWTRAVLLL